MTSPTPETPAEGPRPARWTRLLLFASLALNLIVVGAVVGSMLGRGPSHHVIVRDISFGAYTEALSPEDRAALRAELRAAAPAMRDIRQSQRSEQEALLAALRTVPFEAQQVRDILARQRDRASRGIALGHDLMLQRIEAMDDEARAEFAGRLQEELLRPRGRRPGPPGGDMPPVR